MTYEAILTAVFTKLSTVSGLPKIMYPNINNVSVPDEYIAVYSIPTATENLTIDGKEYQYGLVQVDCVVRANIGEIKAAQIADKIINAFKVGTVIASGLKVNKPSYASAGLNTGDGHYKIPVTIRYQCTSLN